MTLIFAGDIHFEQLCAAVETAFADWSGGVEYPSAHPAALQNAARGERIQLSDKPSVSVRYAFSTGLRRTDSEYLPFMIGNYLLGGSFSSRLMQDVRKKRGLTYSIYSHHIGDIMTAGNWQLGASFAPSMLENGLNATNTVLKEWYKQGVTEDEVQLQFKHWGSYMVRLSTTGDTSQLRYTASCNAGWPPTTLANIRKNWTKSRLPKSTRRSRSTSTPRP